MALPKSPPKHIVLRMDLNLGVSDSSSNLSDNTVLKLYTFP